MNASAWITPQSRSSTANAPMPMRRKQQGQCMADSKSSPQSPGQPLVSVENLSVDFRGSGKVTHAVKHISFDIGKAETVALVGESGSGKTVTALSILRLLPYPAASHPSGLIHFKGEDLMALPLGGLRHVRGNQISMIFQEPMPSLNPLHTIEQQIGEVLKIHRGLSDRAAQVRVLDLLAKVGIEDPKGRLDSYPHQLSGGQRQRVMIAMALANEPALIIADEPTTALDVTTQARILRLLRKIQRTHRTGILFITHDFGVVEEIADRVVVMRHGRVVEQGSVDEVLRNPQNTYTKMLLEAVPSAEPPPARLLPKAEAPILTTQDLQKTFGDAFFLRAGRKVRALDDVSIDVHRGETLGIVGESGSGKSTLARCIARLIDPSGGEIRLDGEEIGNKTQAALRPFRRRVQIVFQDPYRSLNPQ